MRDGELPRGFEQRVLVLPPTQRELYRRADWNDALVILEQGDIVLEASDLTPLCRLRRGAVVSLAGLAVHSIRNPGREPAVLTAVWRRRPERNPREPDSPA